jgi:RNA polymerase sigma factor (sigma-70 family)
MNRIIHNTRISSAPGRNLEAHGTSAQVLIRPGVAEDLDKVVTMTRQLASETVEKLLPLEVVRAGVQSVFDSPDRGQYYLACVDGEVVGQLAVLYRELNVWRNGDVYWIDDVYVREEWRGLGIYRSLFTHVQQLVLATPGVCGIRLHCDRENTDAQAVYQRLGMRQGGVMMEWFRDGRPTDLPSDDGTVRIESQLNNAFLAQIVLDREWLAREGAKAAMRPRRFSRADYDELFEECQQHLRLQLCCPTILGQMAAAYRLNVGSPDQELMRRYARGWMIRMALAHLRSSFDRHQRRCISTSTESIQRLLDGVAGGDDPLNVLVNEEDEAFLTAFAARVERAMYDLPSNQRRVFEAVVQKGKTLVEVAKELGHDRGTIAAWLDQACKQLRQILSSDACSQSRSL